MVSAFQALTWVGFAAALMVPSFATWSYPEKILDMEMNCDSIVHLRYPSVRLRMYNLRRTTKCSIHFTSREDQRMMGRFQGISHSHRRSVCPTDWIQMYDGNRTSDPLISVDGKCSLASSYECSQNFLTVVFRRPSDKLYSVRWEMVISQFRISATTETVCKHEEFRCDTNRCIDKRLMCDANYNCNDRTDERKCHNHISTGAICGIAVGSLIAIVSCIAVCMILMHKRRHAEDAEVPSETEAGPLPEKKLPPIDNTAWAMPPAYDAWLPTSTPGDQTWQASPPAQTVWQPSTPPPEYKPLEEEQGNVGNGNEAAGISGQNTEQATATGGEKGNEHEKY